MNNTTHIKHQNNTSNNVQYDKKKHQFMDLLNINTSFYKQTDATVFCKLKIPKIELKVDKNDHKPYIVGVSPSMR